jgi:hypothetical protein
VITFSPQEAWQKVKTGQIIDAKTITALSLAFFNHISD